MSTSGINSVTSSLANGASNILANRTQPGSFDPQARLDKLTQGFITKNDKDGDGALSSSEVGNLSADAFKALDTNGDGKLDQGEIEAAVKKAQDQIKQAFQSGGQQGVQQALDSLKDSPEGQLLQAVRSSRPHHHHGAPPAQSTTPDTGTSAASGLVTPDSTGANLNVNA